MQVASELVPRQVRPELLEHVDSAPLAAQVDEVASIWRSLEGIGAVVQQHFYYVKIRSLGDCELNERKVAYFLLKRKAFEDELVQSLGIASHDGFFDAW